MRQGCLVRTGPSDPSADSDDLAVRLPRDIEDFDVRNGRRVIGAVDLAVLHERADEVRRLQIEVVQQ